MKISLKKVMCFMLAVLTAVSLLPVQAAEAATKNYVKLTGDVKLTDEANATDYVTSIEPTMKFNKKTGYYTLTVYEDTIVDIGIKTSTSKYTPWIYRTTSNNEGLVYIDTWSIVGNNDPDLDTSTTLRLRFGELGEDEDQRKVIVRVQLQDRRETLANGKKNSAYGKWYGTSVKFYVVVKQKPETIYEYKFNEIVEEINPEQYNTEYEKAEGIASWIHKNIKYDHEIGDTSTYYAVMDRKCVCSGFAGLFERVAKRAGLECKVISGRNHAWALVKCDGLWYMVDPTNHGGVTMFAGYDESGNVVTVDWRYTAESYEYFKKYLEPEGEKAALWEYEDAEEKDPSEWDW